MQTLDRLRVRTDGVRVPDVDPGRLTAILAGERAATSLDLALIATAAGVTVEWLLHGGRVTPAPVRWHAVACACRT